MKIPANWKKFAPGIYTDDKNQLNVVQSEICAHLGIENTKENGDIIAESLKVIMKKKGWASTPFSEVYNL